MLEVWGGGVKKGSDDVIRRPVKANDCVRTPLLPLDPLQVILTRFCRISIDNTSVLFSRSLISTLVVRLHGRSAV